MVIRQRIKAGLKSERSSERVSELRGKQEEKNMMARKIIYCGFTRRELEALFRLEEMSSCISPFDFAEQARKELKCELMFYPQPGGILTIYKADFPSFV